MSVQMEGRSLLVMDFPQFLWICFMLIYSYFYSSTILGPSPRLGNEANILKAGKLLYHTKLNTAPFHDFEKRNKIQFIFNGILRYPLLLSGQDTLWKFVTYPNRILFLLTHWKARCSSRTTHQCRTHRDLHYHSSDRGTIYANLVAQSSIPLVLLIQPSPSAHRQCKFA